jgi:hypothetical protein
MKIKHMGFVLEQDIDEPRVWVYSNSKRVMHVLLERPLSEKELSEDMTELFQMRIDCKDGSKTEATLASQLAQFEKNVV